MKTVKYPKRKEWASLVQRPTFDTSSLNETVSSVLGEIKKEGDSAVRKYTAKFDDCHLTTIALPLENIETPLLPLSNKLKEAIQLAANNITKFHEAQVSDPVVVETMPGVKCWQKPVPIEKVGLYIPGGTAPLFSTVLMLALPAKIAGCKEVVLCTPPSKEGDIHPAIIYAAKLAGVKTIYKIGGVQAIGAMAYGTETVPKVNKIFGPGNQYVTAAKQLVSTSTCAIDMPAGPSEVAVIADDSANPAFVAADLLSQAEHGTDSQVIVVTQSEAMAKSITEEVWKQVEELPRADFAKQALENSRALLLKTEDDIVDLINEYAPEHLIISTNNAGELATRITNAGSIFIGHFTPESAGDYASGTNHTLPTHGWAKSYSGVNMDAYCKKITYQEITPQGMLNIGPSIEEMAETEELYAHKNAATLRIAEAERMLANETK